MHDTEMTAMGSEPRLTTELVARAEANEDAFARAWADRHISEAEARELRRGYRAMVTATARLDSTVLILVAGLRRGVDAPRFRRALREHDRDRAPRLIACDGPEAA